MKFACLVYIDNEIAGRLTEAESTALTDKTVEADWELRDSGRLILGQPLVSPEHAVTIRARQGKLSRSDGPFAETREFLGGFYLIEARDMAEAIAIVEADPMAEMGSVEIRPFLEHTHSITGQGRPPIEEA